LLFRDEKKVEEQLVKYRLLFKDCIDSFKKAIELYFQKNTAEFEHLVKKTHSIESNMDNLKREISYDLYSKTLLPESRGDILLMLSAADKIPTAMENILFDLQCESVCFPEKIMPELINMLNYTYDILFAVVKELEAVFDNKHDVLNLAKKIDEDESFCDKLQRRILKTIFSLDIDFGEKVILKLFIESSK